MNEFINCAREYPVGFCTLLCAVIAGTSAFIVFIYNGTVREKDATIERLKIDHQSAADLSKELEQEKKVAEQLEMKLAQMTVEVRRAEENALASLTQKPRILVSLSSDVMEFYPEIFKTVQNFDGQVLQGLAAYTAMNEPSVLELKAILRDFDHYIRIVGGQIFNEVHDGNRSHIRTEWSGAFSLGVCCHLLVWKPMLNNSSWIGGVSKETAKIIRSIVTVHRSISGSLDTYGEETSSQIRDDRMDLNLKLRNMLYTIQCEWVG